jgi:1-acyl-sn-glycerol-3-phosphate acyltransferase
VLLCGGGIPLSICALLLSFILPAKMGKRLGRRIISGLLRFFLGYISFWRMFDFENDDVAKLRAEGGLIIAPNHISVWDAAFFMSRLPNVVCIAKTAIMRNPVFGGFSRLAGFIPNDHPASMIKRAAEELKEGANLLVFPEGTRTVTPPVNHFKGGFALIAKRSGAPIHTFFISANSPFLCKGWPPLKLPELPYRYKVRIGERFEVDPDIDIKTFLAELESHFASELPADPRRDA